MHTIKILLLTVSLCTCGNGFSQSTINELVAAENSFAEYAVSNNTRDAFLKNIDSNAVHLDNKGNSVNGMDYWRKAEIRPAKLKWMPAYAEISSSGNFGFTTGPWFMYQKSVNDTPVARGHFVTVWHLNNQNSWKFLLDLGVSYKSSAPPQKKVDVETRVDKKRALNTPVDITIIEQAFIQVFNQSPASTYDQFLSSNSRLNKEGALPAITATQKQEYISSIPTGLTFLPIGSFVSSSNDLAVVYGNTVLNGKKERYMRIWRMEKEKWRLALEVLHY